MKIRNISSGQWEKDLSCLSESDAYLFIVTFEEIQPLKALLNIDGGSQFFFENLDENIRFESLDTCDFISFVRFELKDNSNDLLFEKINVYYGGRFLILVVQDSKGQHENMTGELKLDRHKKGTDTEETALLYCRFFNNTLSFMFNSLCKYEERLIEAETRLLTADQEYRFENIVQMKSLSFNIKKYLRLLLYVGDQILDNENQFIPAKQMRYFKNLDIRINRLYEFSDGIHEMSEHLLSLYDSAMASKTNNLINKLTLFTVFATPLTVISGIYGMNFVNMPELRHEYAYFMVLGLMLCSLLVTYRILKKIKLL